MRALLIAALLLLGACSGGLGPGQAAQNLLPGVVESVAQLEPDSAPEPDPQRDQDDLAAPSGTELVVRLDDGRTVMLTYSGPRRFEAGQRVRVHLDERSAFVM